MNISHSSQPRFHADLIFTVIILGILAALSIALEYHSLKHKSIIHTAVAPVREVTSAITSVVTTGKRMTSYDKLVYDLKSQELADEDLKNNAAQGNVHPAIE